MGGWLSLRLLLLLLGCIVPHATLETSPVDDYEMGLRFEILGLHREALASFSKAIHHGTPAEAAIERLTRLERCEAQAGGSPFLPPGCSDEGHAVQLEGGLTVESVAWGECGELVNAAEAVAVGRRFLRSDVAVTELVLNTPDDIDEVVLDGCEKGDERGARLWHTLQVSSKEGLWQGLEPLSWTEGDDPFLIARLFVKYMPVSLQVDNPLAASDDLPDDGVQRPIFALIVQRQAALRNRTLNATPPPWDIPSHLLADFTMRGAVRVGKHYVDESTKDARNNYEFGFYRKSRSEIDAMVEAAERRETRYYSDADAYLYQALDMIGGIKGKEVVIMGSLEPWYESICLAFGASSCTTIEYNQLEYEHSKLSTYTVDEYKALVPQPRFDVAFSISSFEHDGLGRYGDPIDPGGDVVAMQGMRSVLREGGIMLLAVPVGKDLVYWNAHRKYGRVRLPVLFRDWAVLGQVGLTEQMLDNDSLTTHDQPVWVLRNTRPASPDMDWTSLLASRTLQVESVAS